MHDFPKFNGSYLPIDDSRIDLSNPSCLSNPKEIIYGSSKSSIIISPGLLQSNRTNQFLVHMEDLQNVSVKATGYVLVKIEDTYPPIILIR